MVNNFHVSLSLICHPCVSDIQLSSGPLASVLNRLETTGPVLNYLMRVQSSTLENQFPQVNFHRAPGSHLLSYHRRTVCFVFRSLYWGEGPLFKEYNDRNQICYSNILKTTFDGVVK